MNRDEYVRAIAGADNPTSADVVLLVFRVHVSDDTRRADETPAARRQNAVWVSNLLLLIACIY